MPEELTPEPAPVEPSIQPEAAEPPQDFREYERWRKTGEVPKKPPAAAEAPAKTEPDSGPEKPPEPPKGPDDGPEEDEEAEGAEPGDAARKRGGSRQRKIDKLTRELEDLKRVIAAAPQPATKPQEGPKAEGKPKLENFDTLEAYQEALTDYKIDQRERAYREQAEQRQAAELERKLQSEWAAREKAVRKAHPDYDDALETAPQPAGPIAMVLRQALLEDEQGAEVLYWLAKNPAELKRITALGPVSAVREVGKIAARLAPPPNGDSGAPKKQVTSAPKPPPAVTRPATSVSDSIDDPDVQSDYRRWERLRRAQLKERD